MPEITIHLYQPGDATAIAEMLNKQGKSKMPQEFDRDLDEPGERIRDNTFVATVQEEIVAYASLCFVEQVAHFDVYCYATVDLDWRRQGIGSTLFRFVIEHLQSYALQETKPLHFIHRADTRIPGIRELGEQHGMTVTSELAWLQLTDFADLQSAPLPNGFAFRAPTVQDAAAWAELDNAAFARQGAKKAENVVFEFESDAFSPEFYLLCETADGTPVGFVVSHRKSDQSRIPTVAVHPDFQGLGIGKALVTEVINRLHKSGATSIGLTVETDNHNAYALYRKLGFELEGKSIFYTLTMQHA
ncbi:MAG: GNAT family N-acetyltransferase [Tumebacillaceae bacterium]